MYPGCVDVCIQVVLMHVSRFCGYLYPGCINVSRLCGCMYPGCVDICIQVVWMYVS